MARVLIATLAVSGMLLEGSVWLFSCRSAGRELASADACERNAPCYICHMTFVEEGLAAGHARHGVPCVQCHGPSEKHATDETFSTRPDVSYSKGDVDTFCRRCHAQHPPVSPGEAVKGWLGKNRERLRVQAVDGEVVCTDCHGDHRIDKGKRG